MHDNNSKNKVSVLLANPRGFCAGVVRAIKIVEETINKFGPPVYVRHDIVHNHHVVSRLKTMGAVFVEELSDIPDSNSPVIFSAHGVSQAVVDEAQYRNLQVIDATCPLVTKVHREAERWVKLDYFILFIGHKTHPEAIGTTGRIPKDRVRIIETVEDALAFVPPNRDMPLAYVTQTTLSVNDCQEIISALKKKFPEIFAPQTSDICYATTNRQKAVISIAPKVDTMLVIGAPHSSNSLRLVELGKQHGCQLTFLVQDHSEISKELFPEKIQAIGITASASAPEYLVENICNSLKQWFSLEISNLETVTENIIFPLPKTLR